MNCTFSTNKPVLRKQLRFGHKSALKAYVSSEQLQNILRKFVCVCSALLLWGLVWLVGAAFPPFPLGPCPKTVEFMAPVWQPLFRKMHTALLPTSRTIKSNPSTRSLNGPAPGGEFRQNSPQHGRCSMTTQSHVPTRLGSTKLTTAAKAAISKKAFSKTSPLHSHTRRVTRTTILLYKVLSVEHFL